MVPYEHLKGIANDLIKVLYIGFSDAMCDQYLINSLIHVCLSTFHSLKLFNNHHQLVLPCGLTLSPPLKSITRSHKNVRLAYELCWGVP